MAYSKNFLMKIIDALSFAKTYKGNSSKLINIFGFSENFFLYLKKILVTSGVFLFTRWRSHNKNYAFKTKKYDFCGLKISVPSNF